jgi:glycosyltransferase involved in cell wall biosynthesis
LQKKILIVVDAFTYGGVQKVLMVLIPEWVQQGFIIEIILIQNNSREMILEPLLRLGVVIRRIESKNFFDIFAITRAIKHLLNFQPSIIQAHLYWSQIWSTIFKIFYPRAHLVWVEHNTYLRRSGFNWIIYKVLSKITNEIIAVSVEVQDFLLSKKIKKTRVVLNPISNVFFEFEYKLRKPIFVFLGRLNEQKNPQLAIESFIYAKSKLMIPLHSTLIIGGEGPLLDKLQSNLKNSNFNQDIIFKGQLSELEIVNLLQTSTALLSTSDFEGFALVRVEALACGATVITTNTSGIVGVLTERTNPLDPNYGVIIVERDIRKIAEAMFHVLNYNFWTESSILKRVDISKNHLPNLVSENYLVTFNKNDSSDDLG